MSDKEFKNHCAEIVLRTARGKMRSGRGTACSYAAGAADGLDDLRRGYALLSSPSSLGPLYRGP